MLRSGVFVKFAIPAICFALLAAGLVAISVRYAGDDCDSNDCLQTEVTLADSNTSEDPDETVATTFGDNPTETIEVTAPSQQIEATTPTSAREETTAAATGTTQISQEAPGTTESLSASSTIEVAGVSDSIDTTSTVTQASQSPAGSLVVFDLLTGDHVLPAGSECTLYARNDESSQFEGMGIGLRLETNDDHGILWGWDSEPFEENSVDFTTDTDPRFRTVGRQVIGDSYEIAQVTCS